MISALLIREGKESTWDMPQLKQKGKTPKEIKAQEWRCKFCAKEMVARMGAVRDWHFAHKAEASECPFQTESEPETPQHIALKRAAGEGLRRHFAEEFVSLEYEFRFPHLGRIADALITLKDGSRIAVEAQISSLTLQHLQDRTYSYLQGDIDVVWVFLEQSGGGLRAGSIWETCREWLLDEGYIVLTAKPVTSEKSIPLGQLPK